MRAHRRIDPAAGAFVLQHDIVQPLSHPVQALELERLIACHVQNGGDGMGVVGGELRIDPVGHAQQLLRMGDIADIGRILAGEHREIGQAQNLRPLHFRVPVGPLHQPHHDAAVQPVRQRVKPVDHRACAPAVGLHHHAEPVPARKAVDPTEPPRSPAATGSAGRPLRRRCSAPCARPLPAAPASAPPAPVRPSRAPLAPPHSADAAPTVSPRCRDWRGYRPSRRPARCR